MFPGSDLSSLSGPGVTVISLDQPHWNVSKPAHLRSDSLISPISSRLGHPRDVLSTPGRFCHPSCPAVVWDLGAALPRVQGSSALLALQGEVSLPAVSSSLGRDECGPVTCGAAPTAVNTLTTGNPQVVKPPPEASVGSQRRCCKAMSKP